MRRDFDPQEYHALYFSDLLHILRSSKKRALFFGFLASLLFLGYLGVSPLLFQAEALFKESSDKNKAQTSLLSGLLPDGIDFSKEEVQATTLMKSKRILKRVVEKLGLQMQKERGCFSHYPKNWIDHFRTAMGLSLEEEEEFSFSNVSFLLEKPEKYSLCFHSLDGFDLIDQKGRTLARGIVGEEVLLPHFRFTLVRCPKKVHMQQKYAILMLPWLDQVNDLSKKISILPDKNNASFLKLTLLHRKRELAIGILNQTMKEYESYLKEENERVGQEQVSYLEKRLAYLSSELEKTLQLQVSYLEKNLGTKGFIELKDETKNFLSLKQRYSTKLSDLDFKINLLQEKGQCIPRGETAFFAQKIEELKRQRDSLDLSLARKKENQCAHVDSCQEKQSAETPIASDSLGEERKIREIESPYSLEKDKTLWWAGQLGKEEHKTRHLEAIRKKKQETLLILEELKKESTLFTKKLESLELKKFLQIWKEADPAGLKKEDLAQSLNHLYHLLSVEETMIRENQFFSPSLFFDWEGVDLETARKLFLEYSGALESSRLKKEEYARIQKEIFDPHFEISSLASFFEDSVARDLVKGASQLSLHLCDEKNYAPKERERFREEIAVQKVFLAGHVQELDQRENLKSLMLKEKLHSLQGIILNCLNQEISILEQQKKEFVDKKIEGFKEEKKQLIARLNCLQEGMSDLPEKWKLEKGLKFQIDMGLKVIEKLSENIENKTLLLHLQRTGSKPIDLAFASLQPKMFPLVSSMIMSILAGVFFAYVFALFQGLIRGFPLSQERLNDLGFSVCGPISYLCEHLPSSQLQCQQLETLRKMMIFLESSQLTKEFSFIVSILSNEGPNYSHSLADLLSRHGKMVLLIDTSFRVGTCGFLQYLSHKVQECPVERKESFDLLVSGGENLYGLEVLNSRGFRTMIACLKEKYDAILLYNESSLKNMEPQVFLPLSDFLLLTYEKETLLELKPFTDWANFDKKGKLMLIEKKSEV